MRTAERLRFMVQAAVIAALYAALTFFAASLNLAYGPVQFRFSEALTVLPVFTPAAIPGLTLGCFISNLMSPLGVVDWIFGSLATLLASVGTRAAAKIRVKGVPILAPLPAVISNAVIIGFELSCLMDSGSFSLSAFSLEVFAGAALWVGLGELAVCCALGLPLIIALEKTGAASTLFK